MKNERLSGNLMLILLTVFVGVGMYTQIKRDESLDLPLVSVGCIVLIIIINAIIEKVSIKKKWIANTLAMFTILFGFLATSFTIAVIASPQPKYIENAALYNETVEGFSDMPRLSDIDDAIDVQYYTFNREKRSKSATVIIQYDAATYWKNVADLSKYGEGDTLTYTYPSAERGSFNYDGYKFIIVDSSRSTVFEKVVFIGINNADKKIAYICFGNLTDEDPMLEYSASGRAVSVRVQSMDSFIKSCGWERHKAEKAAEQTTE